MKNVTLAFDEQTLEKGREKARSQSVSFNAYVRQLIWQDALGDKLWVEELFHFMDSNPLDARGVTWSREELYERG